MYMYIYIVKLTTVVEGDPKDHVYNSYYIKM